jgi:hypothetical protein
MVDIFVGVSYTASPTDSLYLYLLSSLAKYICIHIYFSVSSFCGCLTIRYAEVWGTDKQGQAVPVAWAAGMVTPQVRTVPLPFLVPVSLYPCLFLPDLTPVV